MSGIYSLLTMVKLQSFTNKLWEFFSALNYFKNNFLENPHIF